MLAALVIFPVTLTNPAELILPPVMLPVALIAPTLLRFCAVTFPEAETMPPVIKLPPETLAVTVKEPKVPTAVKLAVVTLELRVLPVIKLAGELATTPLSAEPLPTNNPPVTTLPLALIIPLPLN